MTAAAPATQSPEWHHLRSQGVGASEIATVAGIGRWGSRWQIWAEKVGLLQPESSSSEAQRTGLRMEKTLAEWFTEDTGLYVGGEQMHVRNRRHPWVVATLDGLAFDGLRPRSTWSSGLSIEDALGPVDFKDTGDATWTTEPWDAVMVPPEIQDVPLYYVAQLLWQMLAVGPWCDRGWLYAKHSFGRVRCYEIRRDPAAIFALFCAGRRFWRLVERYRAGDESAQPALGGPGRDATAAALAQVFGEGGGGEVDIDHLAEVHAAWLLAKAELKAAGEVETDLGNELKAALGDCEVGLIGGRQAVTWRRSEVERVDVRRLREERPDVAAEYLTKTAQRRLLPRGQK